MITLPLDRVLEILRLNEREGLVEENPRSGQIRIREASNDVWCAVERMGGVDLTAELLGVSIDDVLKWIDQHYVPEPYANQIKSQTGYSIQSLQEPPFFVFDGEGYWPYKPTAEQLRRPMGIGLTCCPKIMHNGRVKAKLL